MKTNCITKTALEKNYKISLSIAKRMITLILLLFSIISFGQNIGDYQSKATGNWNAAATWETWNGTTWVVSGTPTSSNGLISILDGHTVTVTADVTVDQVVIEAGGQINCNAKMTLANGPGDELSVFGTFIQTSQVSRASTTYIPDISIKNGGVYSHNRNFTWGIFEVASGVYAGIWEDGSTCRIIFDSGGFNNSLNRDFYNLEFNWVSGTTARTMEGTAPSQVRGTFKVEATGTTGSLLIGNGSTSRSLTVNNFEITGGNFYVAGAGAENEHTLTVNGNFTQTGGDFQVCRTNNAGTYNTTINGAATFSGGNARIMNNSGTGGRVGALTIVGNTTINGGTLDLHLNSAGTNVGRLFLRGDLTLSSGELVYTRGATGPVTTGSAGVYFDRNGGAQTFTWSGGTLSTASGGVGRRFYFRTSSGPADLNEVYSANTAQETVNGNQGTSIPTGYASWPTTGTVIKNLTIDNAAGVTLSTAKVVNTALFRTSGSLSGTPNVTYASGATLHYNGTAAITTADKEFPSSNGPTNLIVSNPGGVTLHANRTLTGNLTVNNSGVLDLGANTLNRGSAGGTLTLADNTTLRIGGTGSFPTNYSTHSIAATSTVNYNGANQEVALLNSTQSYGNLTLSGSVTKTFAHATDTTIRGNFTVEGVTVTTPTRLNFNGTTAQSIAGLAYNNIAFSNAGTKTFTSNASVSPTSAITFSGTPGTVDFDGTSNNLEFVLQSTVNGTARVGNASGWALNGQLGAERFVPAKRSWRLLTAPLKGNANNSIYANWQGSTNEGLLLWHPQGGGDTGLAVGPQSNIWSYTGTGWASVTNTNTANLYDGSTNNAYLIFATGSFGSQNISSGADATTIRAKGALITGDINHTLTANQFKLIGNPYASPIDTEALATDTANSGSKIWLLDPTNGLGAYVTYDGTNWSVPTPFGNDKYIQSGQAFFIRRNSNTFTVKESHKVAGNSNTWFERNANNETNLENSDRIRLLLYKQDTNNWLFADGALAVNSSNGNNNVDDTDATKISNFNESLFLRNGTTNLSIEYRALPQLGDIQALRLTGTTNGSYQLRLYTENYTNSTIQPYLEDTQTTSIYEIPTDGSEIIVPFEGVVSNSSNPITRFRLVYQSTLDTQDPTKIGVSIYPNPVDEGYLTISLDNNLSATTYALTNLLGQEVQRGNLMLLENVINVNKLPKGVYFITIKQNEKNYSKKIIFN
jgi:Secretion system C-terminal sorting domain